MDTSPSSDAWRASAAVFSGRPDPQWEVPAAEAAVLVAAWEALPPSDEAVAEPPSLGYRGARLDAPDGRRWDAYGGGVTQGDDTRADAGRHWERLLLATAPAGSLPPFAV
jgi:hypothetical protein